MEDPLCSCEPPTVTIAGDIGATYSAAAQSVVRQCPVHQPQPVKHLVPKFPTIIGHANGNFRLIEDGDALRPGEEALKYFKALLLPDGDLQALKNDLIEGSAIGRALERCEELHADQRKAMFRHYAASLLGLAAQIPDSDWTSPGAVKSSVVTYPGIYDVDTVRSFRTIVRSSSTPRPRLVTEHEAALGAAIGFEFSSLSTIKMTGGSVLVADIGGLTVDATFHQFTNAHRADTIPSPAPISKPGGTMFLDAEFERLYCKKMLDRCDVTVAFETIPAALARWNTVIKPKYRLPDEATTFTFQRARPRYRFDVSVNELDQLFSRFIEKVVGIIEPLWKECRNRLNPPRAIYFTGGITQNLHVQSELRRSVARRLAPSETLECVFTKAKLGLHSVAWNAVALGGALTSCPDTLAYAGPAGTN